MKPISRAPWSTSFARTGAITPMNPSNAGWKNAKDATTITIQRRDENSVQPSFNWVMTPASFSFSVAASRSRCRNENTRQPAIKNDTASIRIAQPEPKAATRTPATAAPIVNARLAPMPTKAFADCSKRFSTICGINPINAGYQSAFKMPKTNPLNASNGIDAWCVRNASALIETKMLPRRSVPPTKRARPKRSAATPPIIMKRTSGTICAAVTMLNEPALPPGRSRTPKANAIGVIPFPRLLTTRDANIFRKSALRHSSRTWSFMINAKAYPQARLREPTHTLGGITRRTQGHRRRCKWTTR